MLGTSSTGFKVYECSVGLCARSVQSSQLAVFILHQLPPLNLPTSTVDSSASLRHCWPVPMSWRKMMDSARPHYLSLALGKFPVSWYLPLRETTGIRTEDPLGSSNKMPPQPAVSAPRSQKRCWTYKSSATATSKKWAVKELFLLHSTIQLYTTSSWLTEILLGSF